MAVKTANILPEDEGGNKSPNEHSHRIVVQVHCTDTLDTAAVVLSSPLVPRLGTMFTGWLYVNGVYVPKLTPDDPNAVVVDRRAKRSADSPFVWEVTLVYEGIGSPMAKPPDVKYSQVPYQEQVIQDREGRFIRNSAEDLYDGGLTRDFHRGLLTITRNVPYDGWDPDKAEQYRSSLNLLPYRHGTLKRAGVPIESPPQTAKIRTLDADRQVTRQNPDPLLAAYHWQVTCQIEFDYSTFTTSSGVKDTRRWKKVVADAGFNELVDGLKKPITLFNRPASTPQLLDGKGRRQASPGVKPPITVLGPLPPAGAVIAEPDDYYTAIKNRPLVIAKPGVLSNDSAGIGDLALRRVEVVSGPDPAHGTLTLASGGYGGGFTFTPTTGYVGWASFDYKVENEVGFGNRTTALILVVDDIVPVRVFELYDPLDWTDITSWVGNW